MDESSLPDKVNAAALNSWLFNKDTVDKVLQHLMEHGHKVEGRDRLAKTILFARNHTHAQFIEERFNHHYPQHKGHFARVIDHYATYPQSLLDHFSQKDNAPHIAISVDMLDTGIDIPEVANLVFFKPVYSKIKFWQMIGRGTRLCPELFGPGDDKQDFRVFDFCFNFDFFRENPAGIEGRSIIPLGTRLFRSRVQLLTLVQATPDLDPDAVLAGALTTQLHGEVAAMNRENFIVRMHLEAVDRFRERTTWAQLNDADREVLQREVAGLPSEVETDEIESRMFDLTALRMQVALAEGNMSAVEESPAADGRNRHAAGGEDDDPRRQGPARIPGLHAGERLLGGGRPARSRRGAAAPTQAGALPRQEEAEDRLHRLSGSGYRRAR